MLTRRAALRVGRLDVLHAHLSRAGGTAAGSTYDWSAISPPPLPLPPLEETAARYLEQLRPLVTPGQLSAAEAAARAFIDGAGARAHAELEARNAADSTTSYVKPFWDDM